MLSLLTRDPSSLGIDARDKLIGRGLREQHSLACIGINTNLLRPALSFVLPSPWFLVNPIPQTPFHPLSSAFCTVKNSLVCWKKALFSLKDY